MAEETFKLGLDVVLDPKGMRNLASSVGRSLHLGSKDSMAKGSKEGLDKATRKWITEVDRDFAKTIVQAARKGLSSASSSNEAKAFKDKIEVPFETLRNNIVKAIRSGDEEQARLMHKRLREEAESFKRIADARQSAFEDLQQRQKRSIEEQIDAYQSGFQNLGSNILGGDIKGLFDQLRGGGQRIRQRGMARIHESQEMRGADPKRAKAARQMGQTLAKLGKGLGAFAAIAGAIVVLIKLFIDLEAKIKDMNKALLDTAGAASFGFSAAEMSTGALSEELEKIRDQTTAVNKNFMDFRASAKEQQEILVALNEAGLTYRKMREEIKDTTNAIKDYSDVTVVALTYSKLLGKTSQEMAADMGQMAMETGEGLEQIQERFAAISREALASGFQTKRFYSTVLEVTSGLAQYNVRVDQTASLLKTLGGVLGQVAGEDMLKTLTGKYKTEGAQSQLEELIKKSPEFAAEQLSKAAENSMRNLLREMPDIVRDFGGKEQFQEALQTMSVTDLRRQMARMGLSPEDMDRLEATMRLFKGGTGGLAEIMQAMPFAGPEFELAMKAQGTQVFAGQRIDEIMRGMRGKEGAARMVALQEVTGLGTEEVIQLDKTFGRLDAQFAVVQGLAEQIRKGQTVPLDELTKVARQTGLTVDPEGTIRKAVFDAEGNLFRRQGDEVNDLYDVLFAQGKLTEKQMKQSLSLDQQIAKQVAANTSGLGDILEQSVASILNDIYEVIVDIASFLFRDDEEKQFKLTAVKEAKTERDNLVAQQRAVAEQQKALREQMLQATQMGEQERAGEISTELEKLNRDAMKVQEQVELAERNVKFLQQTDQARLAREGVAGARLEFERAQGRDVGELDQTFQEALTEGGSRFGKISYLEDFGGALRNQFQSEMSALFKTRDAFIEDSTEKLRERLRQEDVFEKIGGEAGVDEAIMAARAAARGVEEAPWYSGAQDFVSVRREEGAAFSAAAEQVLVERAIRLQEGTLDQSYPLLEKIAEGIDKQTQASEFLQSFFTNPQAAQDMILPSGGKPIILNSEDQVMAAKRGGAIDRALSKGGVNVNIYGGDLQSVYKMVQKAIKTAQ